MGLSLFQKLTESELDNCINEIDLVVEFHINWLSELNRAIICHTVSERQQIKNILITDEYFNRWYHGVQDKELIEMPAFKLLGDIHGEMLKLASSLLAHASREEDICVDEYDRFILLTHELRAQITELKNRIKENLQLVAKLMGKVFENAEEGVMITNADSYILNVNQAFTNVTQYTKEDVLGKKPSILHSGTHDKGFYERMWDVLLREKRWQGEVWNKRKNREVYPAWLSITAVLNNNGDTSHYIGIFSDVSVKNEGDERLYHLAHYDSLCDLPNRMLFYDRLRQSVSRAKRNEQKIAVMFMDLDGFKQVNDEYGHGVGDELLQQVSKRVTAVLRESDTLARIGGDEFTIIINDVDRVESIDAIAIKILAVIQEDYSLHDLEFNVSASLGISLFPDNSEDMNTLVNHADIAMYNAKKEGKNCFKYYDRSMQ